MILVVQVSQYEAFVGMRYSRMRYSRQQILRAMEKAGVSATADLVKQVLTHVHGAVAIPGEPQPTTPITTQWQQAADKAKSNAAKAALHDRIQARRRPGGKIMPRPRWSADEEPRNGWQDGTERIVPAEPPTPPIIGTTDGSDPLALLIAAMQRPAARKPRAQPCAAKSPAKVRAPVIDLDNIQDEKLAAIMGAMKGERKTG